MSALIAGHFGFIPRLSHGDAGFNALGIGASAMTM
jgi:hypothetical protein